MQGITKFILVTLMALTPLMAQSSNQDNQTVIVQHADRAFCERIQPTINYQCQQYVQVWLQSPTFRGKTVNVTIQYTTATGEFRTQTQTVYMDPQKLLSMPAISWLAATFTDDIEDITLGVVTVVEVPSARDGRSRR